VGRRYTERTVFPRRPSQSAGSAYPDFTYVEAKQLDSWLANSTSNPLAIISFGAPVGGPVGCPVVSLNLPQLLSPARVEVWRSVQPVRAVRQDYFSAAMNDEVAAVFFTAEERAGAALEDTIYTAYRRLLRELRELGYPHLWRAWNYFPGINDDAGGLERYQRFCIGRHQALVEALPDFPASLPAGTAVGTVSGPVHIFVLAGTRPATHLGNPRQVHAYNYPDSYGPRSPSFARATVTQLDGTGRLFLAGTASVVGHYSRHLGLPEEQTQETLVNLRAMLTHADDLAGTDFTANQYKAVYKAYVRNEKDLPAIQRTLERSAFFPERLIFLQGSLCRRELLVEIEGLLASADSSHDLPMTPRDLMKNGGTSA